MSYLLALIWSSTVVSLIDANAEGEFNVLHSPNSLKFSGSVKTAESMLKDILSACLGLSIDENTEWKGLYIIDPFNTPEAVVDLYINGVSSLGYIGDQSKKFPLLVDEYEPATFEVVERRIRQKIPTGVNKLVDMKLFDDKDLSTNKFLDVFGELKIARIIRPPLMHLKYSIEEDYKFLVELAQLKAITAKVWAGTITPDNNPDFFNFHFGSLRGLLGIHGPNSAQMEEAKYLLNETIKELNRAFVKAYDGSVLVTAIATDVAHKRAVRSLDESGSEVGLRAKQNGVQNVRLNQEGSSDLSEAAGDEFNPDYPVIFNIILWFGVMYFFVLVAVVYIIMDMDPGRDSVIYRMTNPRLKKDN